MKNGGDDGDGAAVVAGVHLVRQTLHDGDGDGNETETESESENGCGCVRWEALGYLSLRFFSNCFPDPVLSILSQTMALNCIATLVLFRMLTRNFGLRGDSDPCSITKTMLIMLVREKTHPETHLLLVYMTRSSR